MRRNDLLSPRTSLRNVIKLQKSKSNDKSETGSIPIDHDKNEINLENEEIMDDENPKIDEIPTDSDLDEEEFDVLKKLPTWKKLKLSVYERRQRYRRRQKTINQVKQQRVKYIDFR